MDALIALIFATMLGAPDLVGAPPRIVSLDFCADQYVLALADPEQILALSVQSDDRHSARRDQAKHYPQLSNNIEDVLALKPDLIIRTYGGDQRALAFYKRLGLDTYTLSYPDDFDQIAYGLAELGDVLGQSERAANVIAQMNAKRAKAGHGQKRLALYLTPSGTTSGSGTLINEVFKTANLDNLAAQDGIKGWRTLPLEALAYENPDYIVTAFFDNRSAALDSWSVSSHPVFRHILDRAQIIALDGALTACGSDLLAQAAVSIREQIDTVHD